MPDRVPDEIYGHPINLLGDNLLEQMGRGLFIISGIVNNPEKKWWWDTGRFEIADQLRRIGQGWVNLSKTHVLRSKLDEVNEEHRKVRVPAHYHILEYTVDRNALKYGENNEYTGMVGLHYALPPWAEQRSESRWSYANKFGGQDVVHKLPGWDGGFCDDRCLTLANTSGEEAGDV